jgi:Arc/MetJ-type ribon-helix-helix transcriptional regulator
MTIELTPEDQKLVEEKLRSGAFRDVGELIHRALLSLPVEPAPARPTLPKKNLVELFA